MTSNFPLSLFPMLFGNVVFARHKGKKYMYVNVCVKIPALVGWWKGWESLKKHATCVTIEIATL